MKANIHFITCSVCHETVDIPESGVSGFHSDFLEMTDTPLNVPRRAGQTFPGIDSPRGLAITREGYLIVVENTKNCISIVDLTNGKKMKSFG